MEVTVFCGIDTHKRTLAACIVDGIGRQRSSREFDNSPEGHARVAAWLRQHEVERIGIEGSGCYGYVLAQTLAAMDMNVVEVPAHRTAGMRKTLRERGKNDPADALAIARLTASEEPLVALKTCSKSRDLQLAEDYRRDLVRERVSLANRVHADLMILAPGKPVPLRPSRVSVLRCMDLLPTTDSVHARVTRRRLERLLELTIEIAAFDKDIAKLIEESGSTLTSLNGVGVTLAATIIGQTGNIDRYPTANHFAAANGTAPIPASSGKTQRMRLNRGGNRRINYALHQMALVQASFDPRAREYIAKHRAAGKTHKEAMRCLKRKLSDIVWKQMRADALTT